MPGRINGFSLSYTAIGGILLWSGIKGSTLSTTFKDLLSGQTPSQNEEAITTTAATTSGTATAGDTGAANAGAAANQALAKQLATSMGHADWTTGQAWADWVSLWNQESGWNIDAANPDSDARGIAQNINGYGSNYLEGNATSQITWGINYIAGRYGSPVMAWAHEQANDWY